MTANEWNELTSLLDFVSFIYSKIRETKEDALV